jgi:branched-chain amino acid transport system ATP-binding protein
MLEVKKLYAAYTKSDKNQILKGIDLSVSKGHTVGILGRNGSGKSTLAKAICGMVPYIQGDIIFNGSQLSGLSTYAIARQGIGFFLQGGIIFPNLTTQENLNFAAGKMNKKDAEARQKELGGWFEILRQSSRLKMKATYLSGGEKHQLALAMILFNKPQFLILDEPSAGLSPANQKAIYDILYKIREEANVTMLIIEQNVQLAKKFTENIKILNNGEFIIN